MDQRSGLQIGVVLPTNMACFRGVIRGIHTFAMKAGTWNLGLFSPLEDLVPLVRAHKLDGILLGATHHIDEARAVIRATNGPAVGVLADYQGKGTEAPVVASVEPDHVQDGVLAAKYFLEKGYRHFAFVGIPARWSERRRVGFEQTVTAAGYTTTTLVYEGPLASEKREWPLPHYGAEVYEWLRKLPHPVAVLACNDLRARELAALCRAHQVRVPDEVALLGVDNDDLECVVATPPLSSVAVPWQRIGFEAAAALASAMEGQTPRQRLIAVPPQEVVERHSTDAVGVSDPDVSAAIRFIRENAHRLIGVEDILRVVPLARRSLEKRFKATLGRSPVDEIRRAHVERAKRLLSQTDLSMHSIAGSSGFASSAWFSKSFRDLTGETPSQYRGRFGLRKGNSPLPLPAGDD